MISPINDEYDADLEECLDWQLDYKLSGKTRELLIKWLTERPQDASMVVDDILQFLQSRKTRLDNSPLNEMKKEDIYTIFKTGNILGLQTVKGWEGLSSKQKFNAIASVFPEYLGNESGLENIVSEKKNEKNQE